MNHEQELREIMYRTKHFSFCDRDTLHTIGISYLTCIKGRVMN